MYDPTWESLRRHRIPDWFRDAKFGIWSHWGPQSVARSGDWYARHLYGRQAASADWERQRPARQYEHHLATFGSPVETGYKDLLPRWRAERFDPEQLMELYTAAGARFFVSMAVHCDNVALWDSREQPWNAARIGPERDIVRAWERAARSAGLPFGLSFHNNWTWRWLDVAHGVDPRTGAALDGRLSRADGVGTWWEGLDPHDLYLRPRTPGEPPDPAWVDRFWRMVREATDLFAPDSVYFDDRRLPFDAGSELEAVPPSTAGLEFLAHYYDRMAPGSGGLATIKEVPDEDRTAVVLDCERRQLDAIEPFPWQFDSSDGEWFDSEEEGGMFHRRKTSGEVIRTLIDVVSKNGTMLLNIPQRADGTIDDRARALLAGVGAWMTTHGEAIYGTRPWRVFGEGPSALPAAEAFNEVAGYNEGDHPYTDEDIRYTSRDDTLYAFVLGGATSRRVLLRTVGEDDRPSQVELLGVGPVEATVGDAGLEVRLPERAPLAVTPVVRLRVDPGSARPPGRI